MIHILVGVGAVCTLFCYPFHCTFHHTFLSRFIAHFITSFCHKFRRTCHQTYVIAPWSQSSPPPPPDLQGGFQRWRSSGLGVVTGSEYQADTLLFIKDEISELSGQVG